LRRSSLRFRLLLSFAGGALLLSTSLAFLTYALARHYLLDQRQASATRQAAANARLLAGALPSAPDIPPLLASLRGPTGSSPVVLHRGDWFAGSLEVGRDALPPELRSRVVDERQRARQRFNLAGEPVVTIGFPLPDGAAYFEVFPFRELDRTLRALRLSFLAGAGATVAGGTALGVWASRRLLNPIAEVGETATAIAGGHLDARLDTGRDRELAALASSFNTMVDTLQERMERDARFASNVSHELRSPLTGLKSAAQLMQARRDSLDARSARNLDLLTGQVGRFERLVQDLLEISRFDAGIVQASLEEVYLGELVLRAVEALDPSLPVEVDTDAVELVVRADKRRLEQVIANLVSNARAHGAGVRRIRVEGGPGFGRIAVEDRGRGVPVEDRTRIFERFYRGQQAPRSSEGGVGLGLSLVAEHVRIQGGEVRVEDGPEGGARFVVEFPVVNP
jgi:signal transduction histidine kinase